MALPETQVHAQGTGDRQPLQPQKIILEINRSRKCTLPDANWQV